MADKSISELTQATEVTDSDLFVLQQGNVAKKLSGSTLKNYVVLDVVSAEAQTLPAGSDATANYDKANKTLKIGVPTGLTGATGPRGATGPANTLKVGTVTSGSEAGATITGTAPNQTLNLVLPKGDKGDTGPEGPQGPKGEKGETGAQGPQGIQGPKGDKGTDGRSFEIEDVYPTLAALQTAFPTGATGAYQVSANGELYIWSESNEAWTSIGALQGPQGPRGPQGVQGVQGPQGPTGPAGADGKSAYQSAKDGGFAGTEANFNAALAQVPGHISDTTKHITAAERAAWNGKQPKITANGLLKGDGNGGVSAAAAGTDYAAPGHNHDGAYLKLTGGTLTGNLTGKYLIGTWLKSTDASALATAATKICVLDGEGWVYYRTPAQILSDIGVPAAIQAAIGNAIAASY